MTRAYVALGSNVDPEANLHAAVRLLAEREHVVGASTFYRTAAIPPGAPDFVNGVLALETPRRALALKLDVLRDVESRLGRARTVAFSRRTPGVMPAADRIDTAHRLGEDPLE